MITPLHLPRIFTPLLLIPALLGAVAQAASAPAPVTIKWLDGAPPPVAEGVSWGVPWPQGVVKKTNPLVLKTASGQALPVQTWPMAYWPDGSLKWSGVAVAATPETTGPLSLAVGTPPAPAHPIQVFQHDGKIDIIAEPLRCIFNTSGGNIFEALYVGNRMVAENAKLIAIREDRSQMDQGIVREEQFVSEIKKVTLEQSGPVRAVVKIEGMHKAAQGVREWLPFVVRFYMYTDGEPLRITHTFIYDGMPDQDYIKGLGMSFTVPFAEELQNRHVRFMGDGAGVWAQPVLLVPGYRNFDRTLYANQLNGLRIPNLDDMTATQRSDVLTCPYYNDYRLTQLGPNSFSIDKRVSPKDGWLHVTDGHRALGVAVLGDVSGGIAVGVNNFWQKYPAQFEINHATEATGEMKVWFWSPSAEAMDVRVYDESLTYENAHELSVNYEDWKPGWGNAYGVANTHDLTLWPFAAVPPDETLVKMAQAASATPLLVCTPEYYHSIPVFGFWSLPERSTPALKFVEDAVTGLFQYYHEQVDQRNWYGFWNFGDIMHNYDPGRHDWRYDVGGWAWDNTELSPDMFLWTMFLRTGDPAIFRMADNMARHTSEVDVLHEGIFYPLGSRHSVNHWGDGAKQPRISHAGLKNVAYYLTTDERLGDLLHEQLPAAVAYDYVRMIDPSPRASGRGEAGAAAAPYNPDGSLNIAFQNPAWQAAHGGTIPTPQVNFGLDWTNYAINFMTEWERTGDTQWRDKITEMMKYVSPAQAGGQLRGGGGGLDLIFGGPEIMAQLLPMVDDQVFKDGWAQTARAVGMGMNAAGGAMAGPKLTAYAAYALKDPQLGVLAWQKLLGDSIPTLPVSNFDPGPNVVNPVNDPVFLGGSVGWQQHGAASIQWALNALETLELAKDYRAAWEAEAAANPAPAPGARGGRGRGGRAAAAPVPNADNSTPAPAPNN